ncbi:hypothetical protein C2E23DRAFT_881412 [Lenzites betulinus]|nr:hypothetical protein C2E23DRAFT_881412 [Lenzites betulinus]
MATHTDIPCTIKGDECFRADLVIATTVIITEATTFWWTGPIETFTIHSAAHSTSIAPEPSPSATISSSPGTIGIDSVVPTSTQPQRATASVPSTTFGTSSQPQSTPSSYLTPSTSQETSLDNGVGREVTVAPPSSITPVPLPSETALSSPTSPDPSMTSLLHSDNNTVITASSTLLSPPAAASTSSAEGSPPNSASSPSPRHLSTPAIIALVISVILGTAALLAALLLRARRRRVRARRDDASPHGEPTGSSGTQSPAAHPSSEKLSPPSHWDLAADDPPASVECTAPPAPAPAPAPAPSTTAATVGTSSLPALPAPTPPAPQSTAPPTYPGSMLSTGTPPPHTAHAGPKPPALLDKHHRYPRRSPLARARPSPRRSRWGPPSARVPRTTTRRRATVLVAAAAAAASPGGTTTTPTGLRWTVTAPSRCRRTSRAGARTSGGEDGAAGCQPYVFRTFGGSF